MALLRAGDALREAQAGVLSGGADARDLRAAADRERGAVDDLVDTARGLLSSSGQELSATTLERVADTLHAAALDDDARDEVNDGRLVRELRHVGLGAGLGDAFAAAPAQSRPARRGRQGRSSQAAAGRQGRDGQAAALRRGGPARARGGPQAGARGRARRRP